MKRILLIAAPAMLLSACGAREPLAPPPGRALPTAPFGATAPPNADALLQPPPQTRPGRSDDLIQSSDQRRSDKFDLPPN
jgi:hypothetical protein